MKRLATLLSWMMLAVFVVQPGLRAGTAHAAASEVPPVVDGWTQVSTAQQLAYINENQKDYLNQNIQLMNNIDMAGYAWIPLGGNGAGSFSGIFDGRGYKVSGIEIHDDTRTFVGFFGEASGDIRNLGVEGHVKGADYTGGLAGFLNGGRIDNSYTLGSVTSGSLDGQVSVAGGLAAAAVHSSITRSWSAASVQSGTANNMYAGGLVGSQGAGTISNAYAKGAITNATPRSPNSFIYSSGLVAHLTTGTIENSYATGAVTAFGNAPENQLYLSGLATTIFTDATVRNSYFDTETTGQSEGSSDGSGKSEGKTSALMKRQSTYEIWDFSNIWAINPGINGGYPYLRPEILTASLPNAKKGSSYSFPLAAFDGAAGGLTWSSTGLPEGMSLSSSGVLQGVPEQSGTFSFAVTAIDAGSASDSANLQLTVDAHVPNLAGFTIGPGNALGSTKVKAEPSEPGHTFAYTVGNSEMEEPLIGDILPAGTTAYLPGTDIPNVSTGQYLTIYETDRDSRVWAWQGIQLEESYIQATVSVAGVRIEPNRLKLTAGQDAVTLKAVIAPSDATDQTVAWSSSNSAVAVINLAGEVTPIAAGTATITVTTQDGLFTANAEVTVLPVPPATGTVTGAVYGIEGSPIPGASVTAAGIRAVSDDQGLFKLPGVTEGHQTVTVAAYGYRSYTADVNVSAGETVDAGRIVLTAIETGGSGGQGNGNPAVHGGSNDPSNDKDGGKSSKPAPKATDMTVSINGRDVIVPFIQEKAGDGRVILRLKLDSKLLQPYYASADEAVIAIDSKDPIVAIDLPAAAVHSVLSMHPKAYLQMRVNHSGFRIPLNFWGDDSDASVATAVIAKASDAGRSNFNALTAKQGYSALTEPVIFSLYTNGRALAIPDADYMERTITLESKTDPAQSTVVRTDAGNQKLYSVPSVFRTENGVAAAVFYAPYNGSYAVIRSNHAFADLQGHWAQRDIESLANKLIVQGLNGNDFAPSRQVTRAEFSAMLVRSLGLDGKSVDSFTDIPSDAWYADAVGAAYESGLITGYANGTFHPDAPITREQMAAMISRTLKFAGQSPVAHASALKRYSDRSELSSWAREPAERLLEAGILHGTSEAALSPKELATRAQSAVLVKRMLEYLAFIN